MANYRSVEYPFSRYYGYMESNTSWIYCVYVQKENAYKIGVSERPSVRVCAFGARLHECRMHNGVLIWNFAYSVPNQYKFECEKMVHRELAKHRKHHEFFNLQIETKKEYENIKTMVKKTILKKMQEVEL